MSVPTTTQATFAATLVDEWLRCGLTDAVVCPGSRSTPLALALADRRDEIRVHVRLDERGACFFALGIAQQTNRPVLVVTTSGTAAAELHPGVLEAHHGRVPLIVCTADRPPELQDAGAPQTVDQTRLFGPAVRWYCEPGPAEEPTVPAWRWLAARSVAESSGGPAAAGPVHLNLAFREPLVAAAGPLPPGRPDGAPWLVSAGLADTAPSRELLAELADRWAGRKGVLVAGYEGGQSVDVLALSDALGWPVLADPRSRCRTDHPAVVGAADALLRDARVRDRLLPEVVVLLGRPWASKVLASFVAQARDGGAEVVAVDRWWRGEDPDRVISSAFPCSPGSFLRSLIAEVSDVSRPTAGGWCERWRAVEAAAQLALDRAVATDAADRGGLSEPALARLLLRTVPATATVVVASSMPVRDIEWYAPPVPDPPRIVANRGANGIDGTCSTALGAAAGGGGPVVALIGDLAFFHDVSALVRSAVTAPRGSCTLVVVDNGGGGIFNFLPQATGVETTAFETLFGTPQLPSVAAVAAGFGLPVADVSTAADLVRVLGEYVGHEPLAVVRVAVPDRRTNVDVHDRLHAAVAEAVLAVLQR